MTIRSCASTSSSRKPRSSNPRAAGYFEPGTAGGRIRTKPRAPLPRYAASLCLLADERVDLVDEAHQRNRLRDIGVGARRADAFLVLAARIGDRKSGV